jgi:hypothetical protein
VGEERTGEEYTAQEAAKILRTTERTIRRRLERGDLKGRRDPISGRWFVDARSVSDAIPERPPKPSQEAPDAPERTSEDRESVEALQRELGDLDRVTAWLMVYGLVNADPDFTLTTNVINGFSDLILEVYGPEAGMHARMAPGLATLPLGVPVTIAAEVAISG